MPLTGFAFGCASNADAFVPSPNQFTYFQGGRLRHDLPVLPRGGRGGQRQRLQARQEAVPHRRLRRLRGHHRRTARKIVFAGLFEAGAELELSEDALRVVRPGRFPKMVEAVEHVTFSGRRARETGQEVLYVTERCVIRLEEGGLTATEIMPGIDPARDVVAASQGRVRVAENARVMPRALLAAGAMELAL
jgi:acyl CoA:acetate/3-ketoacid CoA transferase